MQLTKFTDTYPSACNEIVSRIEKKVIDLSDSVKTSQKVAEGARQIRDGLRMICVASPLSQESLGNQANKIMESVEKLTDEVMEVTMYAAYFNTPPIIVKNALDDINTEEAQKRRLRLDFGDSEELDEQPKPAVRRKRRATA